MGITVLPLVGHRSLKALNAFSALLLGIKMLPSYMHIDYETFFASFMTKTEEEKERLLREAVVFVELSREEVESLICFVKDPNGITYKESNINNLSLDQLYEIVVAVCMAIGRIKISLVSESEKKNSGISQSMLEATT